MMGDFATPAAANGSNICINNNAMASGMNPGVNPNNAGIPKHSTVVERLRQRIEGCRRHHVNCENRYQQAHAEQLEIERRETVSLYQRSLEQRAKKSANNKHPSKQQDPESASSTEQRNNTLIAVSYRDKMPVVHIPPPVKLGYIFLRPPAGKVEIILVTGLQ
jgi:mastermind-like protein